MSVGIHPKHASRSRTYKAQALEELGKVAETSSCCGVWRNWFGSLSSPYLLVQSDVTFVQMDAHGTCRQSTYSSLPWYPWGQWYGSPSVAFPPSRTEDFPGAENPSALFLWQPDGSRLVDTILSKMSLKFSFNRSVSKLNEGQTAALRRIEEARLLPETNAPYFHRRGHRYSEPAELYEIVCCRDSSPTPQRIH